MTRPTLPGDVPPSSAVPAAREEWPPELRAAFAICQATPIPAAVFWGPAALFLYNDPLRTLLGDAQAPASGRPARAAWPQGWELLAADVEEVRRSGQGQAGRGGSFPLARGDGAEPAWFRAVLTPVAGGDTAGVLCLLVETTTEIGAQRHAERLSATLNMIDDHFAIYDNEWRYVYVNDRAAAVLGLPKEQLLGRSIWELFPQAIGNPYYEAVHRAARERAVTRQEYYYAPFGTWFENRIYPLANGVSVLSADITQRKRAEESLRQAQRMEAVGMLAGGVAHEVNNMMTVVVGFGELVLRALAADDPHAAEVGEMVRAGERAAHITGQLLAFSRRQVQQPVVLELRTVIGELTRMLERLLEPQHTLRVELGTTPKRVRTDKTQLEQVLVNLLLNARDAMAGHPGRVTIEAAEVAIDERLSHRHPEATMRLGSYVLLTIRDEGIGMTPEVLASAFLPFFTTKPVGQGTGLGLSTVYGIIKQSGGYVFLESEVGQGTTVYLYLPKLDSPADAENAQPAPPRRGRETILIVEDEAPIRQLATRGLQELGYRILEAENGRDGLAVAEAVGFEVDLVVCDVLMPEMAGREFGQVLASLAPSIPVLYVSGYAGDEIAQRNFLPPGVPLLGKPFTGDALAARVRELLDRTPRSDSGAQAVRPPAQE